MAFSSAFTKASGFIPPSPQHITTIHNSTTHTAFEEQSERGSMSPTKRRTERWLQEHTPGKMNDNVGLHKIKNSRIARKDKSDQRKKRTSFWNLALWFSGSVKIQDDDREEDDDLEGETMIDDAEPATAAGYDNDLTLVGDDYDDGVRGDRTAHALQQHGDRCLDPNDPRTQDWTQEERWLFTKLANRGFEPLLHDTWVMDYPTFPAQLFTADENQVYINNIHSSTGRACRALTDLIMVGSRVRDQIVSDAATERPLFHAIDKYYKWSIADAQVHRKDFIPVVATASAKDHETVESVVGRMTDQLHSLGRQYRDKWRHHSRHRGCDQEQEFTHELPTLTGFVIKYSVVAIVTYDSRTPGSPIRTLGTFDFKVSGQDVWHALAVAVAMIRGRDYLMRLDAEGELGDEVVDYESDPDA